jgi:hypothetical protein
MERAVTDGVHGSDHSTAGMSAERIARNESIFRNANEGISNALEAEDILEPMPFVCECADPGCREMVNMTLIEYRRIREDARTFWHIASHEPASQGSTQILETHDGYVVVEKIGPAGDVALLLEGDPDPAHAAVEGDEPYLRETRA